MADRLFPSFSQPYPMDEREWLLGTSYNVGFECLEYARCLLVHPCLIRVRAFHRASMLDEAKRWFESSTIICKFIPRGRERAEKVRSG